MFPINMLKKDTDSAALFLKEVIPEPQGPGGNKSPSSTRNLEETEHLLDLD